MGWGHQQILLGMNKDTGTLGRKGVPRAKENGTLTGPRPLTGHYPHPHHCHYHPPDPQCLVLLTS